MADNEVKKKMQNPGIKTNSDLERFQHNITDADLVFSTDYTRETESLILAEYNHRLTLATVTNNDQERDQKYILRKLDKLQSRFLHQKLRE